MWKTTGVGLSLAWIEDAESPILSGLTPSFAFNSHHNQRCRVAVGGFVSNNQGVHLNDGQCDIGVHGFLATALAQLKFRFHVDIER